MATTRTRADILTDLHTLNTQAKRTLTRDDLGRPNHRWACIHAHLDCLIREVLVLDTDTACGSPSRSSV